MPTIVDKVPYRLRSSNYRKVFYKQENGIHFFVSIYFIVEIKVAIKIKMQNAAKNKLKIKSIKRSHLDISNKSENARK